MRKIFYNNLVEASLNDSQLDKLLYQQILTSSDNDLLLLINAAYQVRSHYWGREVAVHILNNVQNGLCPEDCSYCAQSSRSNAVIEKYPMKTEKQIFQEAEQAHKQGAFRHCLVFAGREQSKERIDQLVEIVKKLKKDFPMQICVSPGKIDKEDAQRLKDAGLDRLNHNLNTSSAYYPSICSSHSFQERLEILEIAKAAGLQVCSGIIVGMGETNDDIIDTALKLNSLQVESIPVNFFMPIKGLALSPKTTLTPEFCLRILCLFRFLNPRAEIRVAAGREMHLRNLQSLALYPANSLFVDGYLNTDGSSYKDTIQMIEDAGFLVKKP
ncbi:biotin synthase BioB [Candidatus Margulisiibacteriota bacterium]